MQVQAQSQTLQATIQQNKITFNRQLLARKVTIIQQLTKIQQQNQQIILTYPNEAIKKIAAKQLSTNGKLVFSKNVQTIFFGQTCNDFYHGEGILIYRTPQTRFYQGRFQNNCKYGYGFEYIGGDVYIGKFVNNKPEDHNGIFIWANQDVYHGSFVNGMKHGSGKWQSGDQFYSGAWKYNKPEGQGYIKSGLSQYSGQVRNGYKHGKGQQMFKNGDRYEGQYSNGKPQGQGSYFWSNGSIYKGQFKNGLRYGEGVWQFGTQKYQGTYINDKRNGQGKYSWAGGSYYEGSFIDDLRHGYGKITWEQGSYYIGEWFEGFQHGQGQVWDQGKLIEKGIYQKGKLKLAVSVEQKIPSRRQISQNVNRRMQVNRASTNNKNHLPDVIEKKRPNSFHYSMNMNLTSTNRKFVTNPIIHINKANQLMLQKRRQINHRYTRIQKVKSPSPRATQSFTQKKAQNFNKSITKDFDKMKERQRKMNETMNKISLYKKVQKERKNQNVSSKTTNKMPKSLEKDTMMFETQLAPIKWKNFNHVLHN